MDELNGSELGTKSYWNDAYTVEIANFEETGDVGEVWFGEDSIIRVVQWFCDSSSIKQDDSIIDIGRFRYLLVECQYNCNSMIKMY